MNPSHYNDGPPQALLDELEKLGAESGLACDCGHVLCDFHPVMKPDGGCSHGGCWHHSQVIAEQKARGRR